VTSDLGGEEFDEEEFDARFPALTIYRKFAATQRHLQAADVPGVIRGA
jgi:hypothetical protein